MSAHRLAWVAAAAYNAMMRSGWAATPPASNRAAAAPLQLVGEQDAPKQGSVEAAVEHADLSLRSPGVDAGPACAPDREQETHLKDGKHNCGAADRGPARKASGMG
jgi:hypothetical protein